MYVLAPMIQRAWLTQMNQKVTAVQLIVGYGLLGLLTMLISFSNQFWWTLRGINAGQSLHRKMLNAILSTNIRFFDSTPVGRIIQRFSRDLESVDIHLQWSFDSAIHSLFNIFISPNTTRYTLDHHILFLLVGNTLQNRCLQPYLKMCLRVLGRLLIGARLFLYISTISPYAPF